MLLAAPMLISTLYLQWGYSTMFMPICNYNLTKVIDTTLLPLSSKSGSSLITLLASHAYCDTLPV